MAEKLRIPVPDPFGLLGKATEKMPFEFYDPLRDAGQKEAGTEESVVAGDKGKDYIDEQIQNYTYHLQEALKFAPCPGCKKLVISALVGVEIYKRMEQQGMKREEFTEDEIQKIKREVEEKYSR